MTADIHQCLWASACAIEAELDARISVVAQPPFDFEVSFNGGVAPDVARHYADILLNKDLPGDARILDMGCGFGRIAMALAKRVGPKVHYTGLDPNAAGIDWAQRNITSHYPNFSFRHIDIVSRPYNPQGTVAGAGFPLRMTALIWFS